MLGLKYSTEIRIREEAWVVHDSSSFGYRHTNNPVGKP